jgi:hypothetical protein
MDPAGLQSVSGSCLAPAVFFDVTQDAPDIQVADEYGQQDKNGQHQYQRYHQFQRHKNNTFLRLPFLFYGLAGGS